MLDLSDFPRFSLAERERRWGRVRELMRERGCDCLVAPGLRDAEEQTTSRYLSQIGGASNGWVVLPLEGEATAIVDSERNKQFWARAQDWITDIRMGGATEVVPERLRDLGLDGGRIGLTQWTGHYRGPEGNVSHETILRLQAALPKAQLYGENDVLNEARIVKGGEEIAVIERIAAANEQAIQVMCEIARPGLRQQDVWFPMSDVMTRATGHWPARLSVTFDGSANATLGTAIPDRIEAGSLCSQEICARLQGYRAQCNHTIQVGSPGPADYADAMLKTIEVYNEMVARLRPGQTVRELCEYYVGLCQVRGAEDSSGVVVHTNGLGNDYPRMGPRMMRGGEGEIVLQKGMTFTLKPVLKFPSGTATQYGDPLTITDSGARRLGKRAQEPIIVG